MTLISFASISTCFSDLTQNSRVVSINLVQGGANVSLQTTRVIPKILAWSKVDGHVGKRTCGDVTTPKTCGQLKLATRYAFWRRNNRSIVRDVLSVASQAVGITVEYGRLLRG